MSKSAIGGSWDDFEKKLLTPEEIAESDLRVSIICAMIEAREEKGITQKELEEMTGLKQSAISRIERGKVSPSLDTVMKVLNALGKTLVVAPIS